MQSDRAIAAEELLPQVCVDDLCIGAFLDQEFDGAAGLLQEFPLLIGEANRLRRFVLEKEGELLAHAAWRPLTLCSGKKRLRAAGIGLVTTHRLRRGRGYATRLVQHCLEQAREGGAEIALLFAPVRGLYERMGFVPAGRERVIQLAAGAELQADAAKIRIGDSRDVPDLLSMLERHSLRIQRTKDEFEKLLTIPDTRTHVLERSGAPVAYCIEGKGRDLRGVIHEWAGERSSVEHLLCAVLSAPGGPACVLAPDSEPAPVLGPSILQTLAQFLILRPERLGSADPVAVFGDARTRARLPIYIWGLDSF